MAGTLQRKFLKIFIRVFGGVALLFNLIGASIWYQYADSRPRVASLQDGRIYPLNTHGRVVYLTKEEQSRLYFVERMAVGCLVCFGFTIYLEMKRRKSAD